MRTILLSLLLLSFGSVSGQPMPAIQVSQPACPGASITFSDTGSCPGCEVRIWDFGDGSRDTLRGNPPSAQVSHTFQQAGPYQIILIDSAANQEGRDTLLLSLPELPDFSLTPTEVSSCLSDNGSLRLDSLAPNRAYGLRYRFAGMLNDLPVQTDGQGSILVPNLAAGPYTEISLLDSTSGCRSQADSTFIGDVFRDTLSYGAASGAISCVPPDGFITLLGMQDSAQYSLSYEWESQQVGPLSLTSDSLGRIRLSGLEEGLYQNFVVTRPATGCSSDTLKASIRLTGPNLPSANPDSLSICQNQPGPIVLQGNPAGGSTNFSTHSWVVQDAGNTGLNSGLLLSPASPDLHIQVSGLLPDTALLSYTVTDSRGCSASAVASLIVLPRPAANPVAGSVYLGGDTSLNGLPTGGLPPYTHRWDVWQDGGSFLQKTSELEDTTEQVLRIEATRFALRPDTAELRYLLTDSNGCQDTAFVELELRCPPLTGQLSLIPGSKDTLCAGEEAHLQVDIQRGAGLAYGGSYELFLDTLGTADSSRLLFSNYQSQDSISLSPTDSLTFYLLQLNDAYTCQADTSASGRPSLIVNPRPRLNGLAIVIDDVCLGDSAQVQVLGNLDKGIYEVTFRLGGVNASPGNLTDSLLVTGGGGGMLNKFLSAQLLGQSGTTRFELLSLRNLATDCESYPAIFVDFEVNPLPAFSFSITDNSGLQNDDGIICEDTTVTLSVAPGLGTYAWLPGGQNTNSITDDPDVNTTYALTVTDANNCSDSRDTLIVVNPLPVFAIGITDNSGLQNDDGIICEDTTVTLSVAPGLGTYAWLPGGQNTNSITDDPDVNTTYALTVTDANNCSDSRDTLIVVNPLPVFSIGITDNSGLQNDDGIICEDTTVTLSVAPGMGTYAWLPGGQNTNSITDAPDVNTTYALTVTDANNCSASRDTLIVVNPLPVFAIGITDNSGLQNDDGIICEDTSVTLSVAPGLGSYAWLPGGQNTNSITDDPDVNTTYALTVTDANNCSDSRDTLIVVNPLPVFAIGITDNSGLQNDDGIICEDTTVTLSVAPGLGSYAWLPGGQNTNSITDDPDVNTTYALTVTDANNCSDSRDTLITVNPLPVFSIGITDKSGLQNDDGIICEDTTVTLSVAPGLGSYAWLPGGQNTNSITDDPDVNTTYALTVTDANNCSDSRDTLIVVNPLPVFAIGITDNSGLQNDDGIICEDTTVTLSVAPGLGTYAWLPGGQNTNSITDDPDVNTTYALTVTDANNCSASRDTLIVVNPLPVFAIGITDNSGLQNDDGIICEDTTVTLSVAPGLGTYAWLPGGQNTNSITDDPDVNTTYTLTVTDANNCSDSRDTLIVVNPLPVFAIGITDNSGLQNDDGIICEDTTVTLSVAPGLGTYAWLPGGQNTNSITDDPDVNTTYSLTVTDANNCSASRDTLITVNPLPVFSIGITDKSGLQNDDGIICEDTTVTLSVAPGLGTYAWLPGGQNTNSITDDPDVNTTYSLTVTDANNCSASRDTLITVNPLPVFSIGITDKSGLQNDDGIICEDTTVTLSVAPGLGTYAWLPGGQNTNSITDDPDVNTTYSLTVTDANNCKDSRDTLIVVHPVPASRLSSGSGVFALCVGEVLRLEGNAGGGTPPYVHAWSDVSMDPSIGELAGSPSGGEVDVQGNGAGTFSLCYELSDALQCRAPLRCTDLRVKALPGALQGRKAQCSEDPAQLISHFDLSELDGAVTDNLPERSVSWYLDSLGMNPIADPNQFQVMDSVVVYATVTDTEPGDSLFCEQTAAWLLVVDSLAEALPMAVNPLYCASSLCEQDSLQFTNTAQAADRYRYAWDFGDGSNSSALAPRHSYTSPGTYQLQLRVEVGGKCPDTASLSLQVFERPVAGPVMVDTFPCWTQTARLSSEGEPANSYLWKQADTLVSTEQSFEFLFSEKTAATNFFLEVSTSEGCCDTLTYAQAVGIGPPQPVIDSIYARGDPGKLYVGEVPGIDTETLDFQWRASAGIMLDSVRSQRPFYYVADRNAAGRYWLEARYQADGQCWTSSGRVGHASFQGPEVAEGLSLYPNPNRGNFLLDVVNQNTGVGLLTITDLKGREVFQESINKTEERLHLSLQVRLVPGMYLVRYLLQGQEPLSTRLIIE